MNRAFTLLELIFVIIIMGILGAISMDILVKMYKNYAYNKEMNYMSEKLENALDVFSAKLQNRVKNTLIVAKCTTDDDGCIEGNVTDFKSLQSVSASEAPKYKVIEWLGKDVYSYRGMWDSVSKKVKPGWSSFVDLKKVDGKNGEYNITSPYSNFNYVQLIDGNWTQEWGISGYDNVFSNELEVLIFSGSDGRGEITDINHSYGYYKDLVGDSNNKQVIYKIHNVNVRSDATEFNISLITDRNNTFAYEVYYLVNSAYAVIPKENKYGYYDLYVSQNYYPWKDETYVDGNMSLLVDNITYFKYKEDNGIIRLYMCITSTVESLKDYNLTLCKERIVF